MGDLYYDYPGLPDEDDYAEIYGNVSFMDFTFSAYYSNNYYLESGKFLYLYGDYVISLPEDFNITIYYGFNDQDLSSRNIRSRENTFLTSGADSYADYNITLRKSYGGFYFSLNYYDTDLNKAVCYDYDNLFYGSFIFTVAKSL